MDPELKKKITERMNGVMESLKKEFSTIRTGRASISLLDGIQVEYYGVLTPLNQVATLSIPESRLITIQSWDPKAIGEIEKAILKSDLGLTPVNDGKIIRLGIPSLTEERRKQLVKMAKKTAEESRVTIRNIRRDGNEDVKRMEKEKHLSEDDTRKTQEEIQGLTDNYIKKMDEILSHKESEIMEV